jgi:TPR repeat protein
VTETRAPNTPPHQGEGNGGALSDTQRDEQALLSTLHAPTSSLPAYSTREYFRTIAHLGVQAAEALDHAHQNGILHRDVKPANLLVECSPLCSHLAPRDETCAASRRNPNAHLAERDDYKLWITDFGLARIEQDAGMTMTGDLLGTLRYMSPEQALAKRVVVDHRSDVYSLGVTLYELLTLEPAYAADDRQELLRKIAFDEPRKPRQLNPRIPQDLETIVLKAYEKNPADRYATARDLGDDLRAFLENLPVKAKRPTPWQRATKWSRRHQPLVTSAALFTVLLVAVSFAQLIYSNGIITRERNETAAALKREVRLRQEAEASAKFARVVLLKNTDLHDQALKLLKEIPPELLPPGADLDDLWTRIAADLVLLQQWPEAADAAERLLRTRRSDQQPSSLRNVITGPVLVQLGDAARYEAYRESIISEYSQVANPLAVERASRNILLLPADARLMAKMNGLYTVLRRAHRNTDLIKKGIAEEHEVVDLNAVEDFQDFNSLALALIDYRRGNFREAIAWRRSYPARFLARRGTEELPPHVLACNIAGQAIVAMSHYQLHNIAAAEDAFADARLLDQSPDCGITLKTWFYYAIFDRIFAHVLLREADHLIHQRANSETTAPAVLQYASGVTRGRNMYPDDSVDPEKESVKWYRLAAEQGFAPAQLALGYRYAKGRGVSADQRVAAVWYDKAAGQFSWTCCLSRDAAELLIAPLADADQAMSAQRDSSRKTAAFGAAYYRLGRYEESEKLLEESFATEGNDASRGLTALFARLQLAMARWQLNHHEEARELLAEVLPDVDAALSNSTVEANDRAILRVLLQEAEVLMQD